MDYSSLLASHSDFQECILAGLWLEDGGRTVVAMVDTIWESPGRMRTDLDREHLVALRFSACRSLRVGNGFAADVMELPTPLPWGASEFSVLRVQHVDDPWVTFAFLWENERVVEIVCAGLRVQDPAEALVFPRMVNYLG